jgi:hypothetical protein
VLERLPGRTSKRKGKTKHAFLKMSKALDLKNVLLRRFKINRIASQGSLLAVIKAPGILI